MSLPIRAEKPEGFPSSRPVAATCDCGERWVPVHVAAEFIRALRQLESAAGVRLPASLPFLTHRCKRGHYAVTRVAQLDG